MLRRIKGTTPHVPQKGEAGDQNYRRLFVLASVLFRFWSPS